MTLSKKGAVVPPSYKLNVPRLPAISLSRDEIVMLFFAPQLRKGLSSSAPSS